MREIALIFATLALSGCESCDFSFGLIPVTVVVTGTDAVAAVSICPEEQACIHVNTAFATVETGFAVSDDKAPGEAYAEVGWKGYTTCRVPEMVITVEAPGCAPEVRTTDRARPDEPAPVLTVALDCG